MLVFVPLRGISLYIREKQKILEMKNFVSFSSPYEELVYIFFMCDPSTWRLILLVFVPLRGISLYIREKQKILEMKNFVSFSSPYEELVYISKKNKISSDSSISYVFVPLRGISLYICLPYKP